MQVDIWLEAIPADEYVVLKKDAKDAVVPAKPASMPQTLVGGTAGDAERAIMQGLSKDPHGNKVLDGSAPESPGKDSHWSKAQMMLDAAASEEMVVDKTEVNLKGKINMWESRLEDYSNCCA